MSPKVALLLAGALLFAQSASALPQLGEVRAAGVFGEGEHELTGQLLALDVRWHEGATSPPGFTLKSWRLGVERDEAYPVVSAGVGVPIAPETTSNFFSNATVQGGANRPDFMLQVFPLGAARLETDTICTEAAPSPAGTVERQHFVRADRAPLKADTMGAIRVGACGLGAAFVVRGDMVVSLWEWDADLSSDEGSSGLTSGRSTSGVAGPAQRYEQVFLTAREATLMLPVQAGTHAAFLADGVMAARSLHLNDCSGSLDAQPIEAQEVGVGGRLLAELRADGGSLVVAFSGELSSLTTDGQAVVLGQAVAPSPVSLSWWVWLAGGFVLAILAAAAWWLHLLPLRYYRDEAPASEVMNAPAAPHLARARGYVYAAEHFMRMDRPRAALWAARRAARLRPEHTETLVALGMALRLMSRSEEARDVLVTARRGMRLAEERARTACVLAEIEADLGNAAACARWLEQCAEDDLDLFARLAPQARVSPVSRDPAVARQLRWATRVTASRDPAFG